MSSRSAACADRTPPRCVALPAAEEQTPHFWILDSGFWILDSGIGETPGFIEGGRVYVTRKEGVR